MKKIWLVLAMLGWVACSGDQGNTGETAALMEQHYLKEDGASGKIVVYQMMTRLFGNKQTANKPYGTKEENGVGKFDDITTEALEALKGMGVTHVWYTGVIEHAVMADYTDHGISLDDADVVKGRAGSPYAIKDYYDVNPDLANEVGNRMQEFEALVERTHAAGLKVIIDFVPNHVARNYVSDGAPEGTANLGADDDHSVNFKPNNNFYYIPGEAFKVPEEYNPLGPNHQFKTEDGTFEESPAKATGNDQFTAQPSVNDWFETVKLNYGVDYLNDRQTHFEPVPDTWQKMHDILAFWAGKKVDGFRCDMAEMVPVEFWGWMIPKIKEINPEITFTAEIYNPAQYRNYLQTGRFDYLYDKVQLYDSLKHIMQGHGSTHDLPPIWQDLKGINQNMLRFLENHDEQRIASPDFAGDARKGIPAMVVSTCWYTGPVMVYFGQEVGEPGAGDAGFGKEDGRTTIFDYWGVPQHQKWMNGGAFDGGQLADSQKALRQFYSDLLNFAANSPAIGQGAFYDLQAANKENEGYTDKVYSFLRFEGDEKLLIISNFSADAEAAFQLSIPAVALEAMGLGATENLKITKLLGDATTAPKMENGKASITIPPLGYGIFKLRALGES